MSATNRGSARSPRDYYVTPDYSVHALLNYRPIWMAKTKHVLEPCAGNGAIVRSCHSRRWKWTAIDIEPQDPSVMRSDFLAWDGEQHDLVLTNPPFSLAQDFLFRSLEYADHVCFLLSIGWLGTQKRSKWLRDMVPDVYVLPKRPSFLGSGTDATEYAWMHWDRRLLSDQGVLVIL